MDEKRIENNGYYCIYKKIIEQTNNFTRKYHNDDNHVTITWDNFNLKIEFNPSLYMYGNNIKMCSLNDCKTAIEKLGLELGVNLYFWEMVGYDYNVTIEMNHPIESYLPIFKELPRYKRTITERNEGITYENKCKNRTFTVYNKLMEQAKKKVIIPPCYAGKNLLRFEHSIINKMNDYKYFKTVETVKDFLTAEHWNNASYLFENTFIMIKKHSITHQTNYTFPPTLTDNQAGKLTRIIGTGGIEKYITELQIAKAKGTLKERNYKLKVNQARKIWNDYVTYNVNPSNDLLNEVNQKVKQALAFIRIWQTDSQLN